MKTLPSNFRNLEIYKSTSIAKLEELVENRYKNQSLLDQKERLFRDAVRLGEINITDKN